MAITTNGGAGVTADAVATLSNKTLAAPVITGGVSITGTTTISGDLTVNGTTTNINTTNLTVEDKNIIIADVTTPTDTTADGAGITIKGATDKTFTWVNATDAFTASDNINVASGMNYYINGTLLKNVSETLTNKTLTSPVISSITNTGTITIPTSTGTLALTSGVINNTLTTTTGDMIYASSANTPARLAVGTTGQVLTVAGGVPTWAAASSGVSANDQAFAFAVQVFA
ncbi:hypothetical protein UFOVP655_91 [uncultured Caudovirales phage]|uniref:Uncharacterized protein n=1 Tax=uncultured Caudovirales phage TaxID=2100421 RepID=A0A6J5NMW8_9CAUD|nr:hypothetical protein UFOVP655_91 [uncultured Caudovirales phage]